MKIQRRRFLHLAASAAMLQAMSRIASALDYPTRPVRMIVPFAPGGPSDVFARLTAQRLTEQLRKQFYVENIAGANTNVGTGQAAKAAPDGHTMLVTTNNFVVNPTYFNNVSFDPLKDFDPVTLSVITPIVLVVNPSVPAKTVKDLVALIKSNPGKYNFTGGGTGGPVYLMGEQFRLSLGLDLVHVPYNGGGPAVAAVVAGHTPIGFIGSTGVAPYQGRQLACARRFGQDALAGAARHSNHGRSRLSGYRGRHLDRYPRSRRNAKRNRHLTESRDHQDRRTYEGKPGDAGLRAGREHSGGIRDADQNRT
jgi:tripartite-type tricarboxylate transporter receptor subunit TctC